MGARTKQGMIKNKRILYLAPEEIRPNPAQPRRHFDKAALGELADSIRCYGLLQPLSVRRLENGYELVAGERRLRAAKMAGLEKVPCIQVDCGAPDAACLALLENLQRQDLDFIEEAKGLATLIRQYGLRQEELALRLGKSQSAVANKLRILKLPGTLLYVIREAGLTERHARALLTLPTEADQVAVLEKIVADGLNVKQTEAYIKQYLGAGKKPTPQPKRRERAYVIKDVRLFLSTVNRGLDLMHRSGIEAQCGQDETDTDIILTITIPKRRAAS